MHIQNLYLYPIKSLGGMAVSEAVINERGFQYDRRWMLVGADPQAGIYPFMTQREHPVMSQINVALLPGHLHVSERMRPDDGLTIGLEQHTDEVLTTVVWDDTVQAVAVSDVADRWFSRVLGLRCRLVYMPEQTHRPVDAQYVAPDAQGYVPGVSFADGYPYLVIGQASLDELNRRLDQPITMNRFRPNIVVSGTEPNDEDSWQQFRLGDTEFYGVKPCARCVLTTIDPVTGQKGREPLKTLATYRQYAHKILFGQNAIVGKTGGTISIGDEVEVIARQTPWLAPPVEIL